MIPERGFQQWSEEGAWLVIIWRSHLRNGHHSNNGVSGDLVGGTCMCAVQISHRELLLPALGIRTSPATVLVLTKKNTHAFGASRHGLQTRLIPFRISMIIGVSLWGSLDDCSALGLVPEKKDLN